MGKSYVGIVCTVLLWFSYSHQKAVEERFARARKEAITVADVVK